MGRLIELFRAVKPVLKKTAGSADDFIRLYQSAADKRVPSITPELLVVVPIARYLSTAFVACGWFLWPWSAAYGVLALKWRNPESMGPDSIYVDRTRVARVLEVAMVSSILLGGIMLMRGFAGLFQAPAMCVDRAVALGIIPILSLNTCGFAVIARLYRRRRLVIAASVAPLVLAVGGIAALIAITDFAWMLFVTLAVAFGVYCGFELAIMGGFIENTYFRKAGVGLIISGALYSVAIMCTLWNFNITLMNTAVMGNAFGLVMKSAFMMTGGGVFFLMAVVFFTTKRLSRASHDIAAITELLSRSRHEEAINIVSFLEDNGNNAPDGFSLLHAAAKCGSLEMARYLIDHRDVDVDVAVSNGTTPLITAVMKSGEEMVRFLVEHGADVNTVNAFGETPLWWAIENSHNVIAEYLAAHGADVAYRHPDEELTLRERGEMLGLKI